MYALCFLLALIIVFARARAFGSLPPQLVFTSRTSHHWQTTVNDALNWKRGTAQQPGDPPLDPDDLETALQSLETHNYIGTGKPESPALGPAVVQSLSRKVISVMEASRAEWFADMRRVVLPAPAAASVPAVRPVGVGGAGAVP